MSARSNPIPCHAAEILLGLLWLALALPHAAGAAGPEFEGFLEPNQVVDISTPFRDRIERLHVRDGDRVQTGQLLAELDSRVLQADLAAARQAAGSHGAIDAARALVTMRKNRLDLLQELEKSGNARPRELAGARTELAMARARLQSAIEEQRLKKLDVLVIEAKIEEKKLRSPLDGVVEKVYKQQFELIGGGDAEPLLTLVQLDPLLGRFHLPLTAAQGLRPGQEVQVRIGDARAEGTIDFVSPVIDARSGTVTVRVRVPNPDLALTSGSRCHLTLSIPVGAEDHDRTTEQTAADQGPVQ
ncbi:MAG TPA: efflux RND transporter periplasmic adaptor subunit [Desulfobulbus sp.]|nr:efflux RND transporter periplasmic adaptor subunit [Desulfobulbus sp.]